MSKKAFDKIAEGLREAVAIAKGEAKPAALHVPAEIDVRGIRTKTGMSQESFASMFGFSVHQVRQWEQGRHRPLDAMRAYLLAIERDHEVIIRLLRDARAARKAA